MALSVLYTFTVVVIVVQNKMGGAFMNIQQLKERLNQLLQKLKTDLPKAERIAVVMEIEEILEAVFG